MTLARASRFTIVGVSSSPREWRVVGDVADSFGSTAATYGLGDLIHDNSATGINRWKIDEVVSAVGQRLTCIVLWDDTGSGAGIQPKTGTGAISKYSPNLKYAEIPSREKTSISEYLNITVNNINQRRVSDNITGGGSSFDLNIPFYEGTNAPLVTNIDAYNIRDSAGFEHSQVQDVVFSITEIPSSYITAGFTLLFSYAMSTSESSMAVKMKLDYKVHDTGEDAGGGTAYTDTQTFTVNSTADELDLLSAFTIAAGNLTVTTQEVEFRLTRLGTDGGDTHTGIFGLKDILAEP